MSNEVEFEQESGLEEESGTGGGIAPIVDTSFYSTNPNELEDPY